MEALRFKTIFGHFSVEAKTPVPGRFVANFEIRVRNFLAY